MRNGAVRLKRIGGVSDRGSGIVGEDGPILIFAYVYHNNSGRERTMRENPRGSDVLLLVSLVLMLFSSNIQVEAFTAGVSEYAIPTLGSKPMGIDVDPDGAIWFTEQEGKKIGKFNPAAKTFTEYPVTFSPREIAYNAFEALVYFTEDVYANGHCGVLVPKTGAVSQFSTGLPVASAVDCTLVPGRGFWFNGWDSRSVSKANRTGVIQTHIPTSFGYMSGLTEDPEGNLWLTIVNADEYSPRLLKLNTKLAKPGTSHGFTEIPLPFARATIRYPLAALGKIWFPIMDKSAIASYEPAGFTEEIKVYATPTPNAGPGQLAVDRWGRIWFPEALANKIGMLDLRTRTITEFSVPTANSFPWGIAVDTKRDIIWFTEREGNKIGKLIPR